MNNSNKTHELENVYEWNDYSITDGSSGASIDIYAKDGDTDNIRVDLDDNFSWRIWDVPLFAGLAIIHNEDSRKSEILRQDDQDSIYISRYQLTPEGDDDVQSTHYWLTGGNRRWYFSEARYHQLDELRYGIEKDSYTDEPIYKFIRRKSDEEQEKFIDVVSDLFNPTLEGFFESSHADWLDIDALLQDVFGDNEYVTIRHIMNVIHDIKWNAEESWFYYTNELIYEKMYEALDELGWSSEYKLYTFVDPNQQRLIFDEQEVE